MKKDEHKFTLLHSHHLNEVKSTNDHIKSLLQKQHGEEGFNVSTDFQTEGRGTGSNKWFSSPGKNILISYLHLPKDLHPSDQFMISKQVSCSILEFLNEEFGLEDLWVKWPNDIYFGAKKLGGLLIENVISGLTIERSIIGFGLNVNERDFPAELPNPVSLRQIFEQDLDLKIVREKLLMKMYSDLKVDYSSDKYNLNNRYLENLYGYEKMRPYQDARSTFNARITGIDEFGQLMLTDDQGKERIYPFKAIEFGY